MTQRILITGGAGFIGSRLCRALLDAHDACRIVVFDNLHPQVHGPNASPPEWPDAVEFIRGDVGDARHLEQVVAQLRPRLVYHLAAETGTGQSLDCPTRYCLTNVLGTTHLAESLRASGSHARVVLAGSRAVYGEGGYRDAAGREFVGLARQPEAMRRGEFNVPLPTGAVLPSTPIASHAGLSPAPASIYASTKLMQEYVLHQAGEGADWHLVTLRFQNVYGPGQSLRNPYTGVLSIFARQLLSGGDLSIFEDGQIARDFVYVDDVVRALVAAGVRDLGHGEIIDIGSGRAASILEAVHTLSAALGRGDDAWRITGEFRTGDIRHACADIVVAARLLGWKPRVNLDQGLRALATWAKSEFESGRL